MIKIVIAGGGTGGHIYPALSVAEALKELNNDAEVIFIGSKDRLESKLIPNKGFKFYGLDLKMPSKNILKFLTAIYSQLTALFKSYKLLKEIKPTKVVGVGGYISIPTVLAAYFLKIPILLLEQNVVPGKATIFLSFFIKNVAISFESSKKFFKSKNIKFYLTGNPIRKEFKLENLAKRNEVIKTLNLDTNKLNILVMGGSQGSLNLNKAILDDLDEILQLNCQVIHISGEKDYKNIKAKTINYINKGNYKLYPYYEDIPTLLSCIDLAIIRAGATSIAEMLFYKIPMILIPYPHAGSHQLFNALEVQKVGAGLVIEEKELKKGVILEKIKNIITSNNLEKMKENTLKLRIEDSAKSIARLLLE